MPHDLVTLPHSSRRRRIRGRRCFTIDMHAVGVPAYPPCARMKSSLAGWHVPGIVLIVAVALGFVLRLTPCLRHPDFDYILDGQYHRRLVAQVVDAGRLAELDSLSNAPG